MALISCPECGKEISDKAVSCIGCGAPVQSSGIPLPSLPTKISFDKATGQFSGTKALLARLAVKAIVDIGWRVDASDEGTGLVSFTTGMTWGSFSGVSGSIVVEEVAGADVHSDVHCSGRCGVDQSHLVRPCKKQHYDEYFGRSSWGCALPKAVPMA